MDAGFSRQSYTVSNCFVNSISQDGYVYKLFKEMLLQIK
jgi:hypothetical protein